MLRNVSFGLLALLVFIGCVILGNMLCISMFPAPAGMDVNDDASIRAHMHEVPVLAFIVMLLGHLTGALLGGWVVGRFTGSMATALLIGGLMLLAGVWMLFSVPHPTWFWLDAFVYVPAAMAGFQLGRAPGGI